MQHFLFIVAFFLVSLYVLFQGVLMLFWPDKHTRFEDWLARSDRWSERNPQDTPGRQIEKRLAGLTIIVFAAIMLRLPIRWFVHPEPVSWTPPQGVVRTGFDWVGLLAGGFILVLGLYLAIRPEGYARWIIKKRPHRIYADDFIERGSRGLRIFGLILVATGSYLLYFILAG